jgi:hypothetical protein
MYSWLLKLLWTTLYWLRFWLLANLGHQKVLPIAKHKDAESLEQWLGINIPTFSSFAAAYLCNNLHFVCDAWNLRLAGMALFRRVGRPRIRKPSRRRRVFGVGCQFISADNTVEEEALPFYQHSQYYLVRMGEVFESKYQVLGKLGYDACSTVWLCRDLR